MPLGFFSFHGTRSLFFLYQPECKSGCDILFICGLERSHVNFLIHSRSCTAHYCVQSWLCYYTSNLLFMGGVFFRKDYSGSPVKTAGAFCCLMYAFLSWPITWLTSLHVSHLSHDLVHTFDLVLMSLLVLLFFWGGRGFRPKNLSHENLWSQVFRCQLLLRHRGRTEGSPIWPSVWAWVGCLCSSASDLCVCDYWMAQGMFLVCSSRTGSFVSVCGMISK